MKKLITIMAFLIISLSCFSQKIYYKYVYALEDNYSQRVNNKPVCFNFEPKALSCSIQYDNINEYYVMDQETAVIEKEDLKFDAIDGDGERVKFVISGINYVLIGYKGFVLILTNRLVPDGYKKI